MMMTMMMTMTMMIMITKDDDDDVTIQRLKDYFPQLVTKSFGG